MSEKLTLPEAWLRTVATDYEDHMARIGQAQANARLTERWLGQLPLGARLLMAGAGPGQMLDYWQPGTLADVAATFSDLNAQFLDRLRERLAARGFNAAETVEDNILATRLGAFDAAAIVLVLEHVEWRRALASLAVWRPAQVLIVVQENPSSIGTAVTPTALCLGTMRQFRDQVQPGLIPVPELLEELRKLGYGVKRRETEFVADRKMMHALWLERGEPSRVVHTFRPELAAAFERLNREWLETYFAVEPKDLVYFQNTFEKIIEPGGQIFFLEEGGEMVGTCSAVWTNQETMELGKLAVTATRRGQGYGRLLANEMIHFARERGCSRVVLFSSSKLSAALGLYEALGFRHLPHKDVGYSRGDVTMELWLN
jgi:GNAT superfamily N-acetyltransferase